jgi:glutathione peroxidase
MKKLLLALSAAGLATLAFIPAPKTLYDFTVTDIDGKEYKLSQLKGMKVMIVNTASECGYTPQYTELQQLYEKYKSQKFVIIGFPANNFGGQEPGADAEIKSFCSKNYGVTFPMMSKISVKGDDMAPIYKWLTSKAENGVSDAEVRWNFNKFLIDANGNWVAWKPSKVTPMSEEITKWIESK